MSLSIITSSVLGRIAIRKVQEAILLSSLLALSPAAGITPVSMVYAQTDEEASVSSDTDSGAVAPDSEGEAEPDSESGGGLADDDDVVGPDSTDEPPAASAPVSTTEDVIGSKDASAGVDEPPAASAATGGRSVTASASKDISLTVYNQNFGLVRDVRSISLNRGINLLRFEDVAAAIDPTTVSFTSLTAPNAVVVREQNYQYDVMDPQTILSKSIGKKLTFRRYLESGGVKETTGTLLNSPVVTISDVNGNSQTHHQGLVLRTDSGVVLNPGGEVQLDSLPPGLVSQPSLLWKLESSKAGAHDAEISYQTSGMSWKCDYVAIVNEDDTKVDMTSWVTLDNQSGASYKNASLKLLAGDVHRVQNQPPMPEMAMMESADAVAAAPQFSEKSFAEYHLYTLAGKTNVLNRETKQLSLFNANNVPSNKRYIYEPVQMVYYGSSTGNSSAQKVNVKMELRNSEENHLGMALPKGKVRVYKKDDDGSLQFIGEDEIDHTPRDEMIRLYIGDAFDVVGERKELNYARPSDRVERRTVEISLRNHKDKKITVTSIEHTSGQWKILSNSHKYHKRDSTSFEFDVEVPARGEVTINYEIESRY